MLQRCHSLLRRRQSSGLRSRSTAAATTYINIRGAHHQLLSSSNRRGFTMIGLLDCGIHNSMKHYNNGERYLHVSVQLNSKHDVSQSIRNRYPNFRHCNTIEELTQMAYDYKDTISPRDMCAYWSATSKHLQLPRNMSAPNNTKIYDQMKELLVKTIQFERYNYRDLATISISMARMIKKISNDRNQQILHNGSLHDILIHILIGNNSTNKQHIFTEIAKASVPILDKFDARHLSNLIYAFGLAEVTAIHDVEDDGSTFFDALAQAAITNLNEFNEQDISNMVWAYAALNKRHSQLFNAVANHIIGLDNLVDFWPQHLSNTTWAYATLNEKHPMLFDKVAEHIISLDNLDRFGFRNINNIMWAYRTAGETNPKKLFNKLTQAQDKFTSWDNKPKKRFGDSQSIEELTQLAHYRRNRMNTREMCAFWAEMSKHLQTGQKRSHSNMKRKNEYAQMQRQVDDILGHTLQDINSFGTRDLATIAISLAKIMRKNNVDEKTFDSSAHQVLNNVLIGNNSKNKQHIFTEIAKASAPILHEFDARHLSNLIYAFGLAQVTASMDDDRTFFGILADHIVTLDNLNEFLPQGLSNLLWAYAKSKEPHPKLYKKLANHIVALDSLDNFKPQEVSTIILAFAIQHEQHQMLLKKMVDHILGLENLRHFNEQVLSNILLAFANVKNKQPKLFRKIADHIISLPSLDEFKPQALSNILWAFATASESHPHLFKKLAEEAIKRQAEFKPQEISNFLWAYATNGQVNKHLFASLVPSVKANLDKYNAQNLANIAWAYSVANVDAPSVFNDEFLTACLKKENDLNIENLCQLHQWQLWQDEITSDISLPESLQMKCYEAFIAKDPIPSKLQDDVVSILSSMGLQQQEEVLMESGYRIDAIVEVNGKQIAVEVDGPSHFIGRELTGSTILKHRQVANLDGMEVVSVPYWEWDKLNKDGDKKQQYLQDLLGVQDICT